MTSLPRHSVEVGLSRGTQNSARLGFITLIPTEANSIRNTYWPTCLKLRFLSCSTLTFDHLHCSWTCWSVFFNFCQWPVLPSFHNIIQYFPLRGRLFCISTICNQLIHHHPLTIRYTREDPHTFLTSFSHPSIYPFLPPSPL